MSDSEYAAPDGYRGLSYPGILLRWAWQVFIWRRFFCQREIHLFDEVWSGGGDAPHYLSCDACELVVHIAGFEDCNARVCSDEQERTPPPK